MQDAEKRIENKSEPNPGVPVNGVGHGAQQREAVGVVNGESGEDQEHHGCCLEPVPDPLMKSVQNA